MIDDEVVERVLAAALRHGGDLAELFVEDRRLTALSLEDARVEAMRGGRERGAGVRVLRGGRATYAPTTDLSEAGLIAAARAAAEASRHQPGDRSVLVVGVPDAPTGPGAPRPRPTDVPAAARVELLRRAEAAAREVSPAIRQVRVACQDEERRILVATSEGHRAGDTQVRVRLSVTCVALGDTGPQVGTEAPGATLGFEQFEARPPEDIARTAARRAVVKLRAVPAPSGPMPVVLARGAGGGAVPRGVRARPRGGPGGTGRVGLRGAPR